MKTILPFLTLLCLTLSPLSARTWTSTDGKEVEAVLVRSEEGKVTLKRSTDGKTFSLPFSILSQADQEFIATQEKSEAPESDKKEGTAKKTTDTEFTDTFGEDWPALVKIKRDFDITKVEMDEEDPDRFVYHSRHFEFIADTGLSNSVIKRFAEIFEVTLQYMQELPISSQKALKHTAEVRKQILLFSKNDKYHAAGGPIGSAGVYMRRGNDEKILVKMTALGLKKLGSRFTLDRDKQNKTLPHEIVHMFTDPCYFEVGARGWFSEGLAEYVAVTPYRGGNYSVRGNRSDIVEYVTQYGKDGSGGRALLVGKDTIKVGPIKDFFLIDYGNFTANGNHNYGVAALITYYFFHLEGKEDRTNITNFMKALQAGKKGEEALEVLLNGRSYEELEEDIQKAWRTRGVPLKFSK